MARKRINNSLPAKQESGSRTPELLALEKAKTAAMSATCPTSTEYNAICAWAKAKYEITKAEADEIYAQITPNAGAVPFTRAKIINFVFGLHDYAAVRQDNISKAKAQAEMSPLVTESGLAWLATELPPNPAHAFTALMNDQGIEVDPQSITEWAAELDSPPDPDAYPTNAPEVCPEADCHCSDFQCLSCGYQASVDIADLFGEPAGYSVNDDGEVEDLPAIFQVLGWTEYPGLPAMPTAEEIAALRDKVDQVVDIVATCRERARRYREQGERRAKAKEARAKRYEQFIAAAAKVLGEHLIPRVQTGERQGAYRQKFLDLPSGRITYKKGGGWQFQNDVLQREIDKLSLPVIAAANLPVCEVRRVDWTKLKALIKRTGNKIPIQSIEATGIAPLTFEGCEEAFEDPLAEICISAGNPGIDTDTEGEGHENEG